MKPEGQTLVMAVFVVVVIMVFGSVACLAQGISGGAATPPPTLQHELFLIVTGAVLGGALGPLFQIVDSWLGITPGSRSQRANYHVQREILRSLRELIKLQRHKTEDGGEADT